MSFDILSALAGGDRRSIGRVDEVVDFVVRDRKRLPGLIDGMTHGDPVVRMRCADAAEKVALRQPEWFAGYGSRLIEIATRSPQQEIRWHVAQMLPRIALDPAERSAAIALMFDWLGDDSRIVTVSAMSALADLSAGDPSLRRRILPELERFAEHGSAAQKSRARKLLLAVGKSGA